MAESGKILTPNVLQERNSTPARDWKSYVVTAPGYRVVEPVSSTLCGAGGFAFGLLANGALAGSGVQWLGVVLALLGIPLGVLYARAMNRVGHNGRLQARGLAARLIDGPEINRAVIAAAKRDAPGYFPLAVRAARLDALRERIRKLERDPSQSAELSVRRDELKRGEEALRLLTANDALARGAALLAASDGAIDAAGSFTEVLYAEIEEGRAQTFDADY